MVVAISKRRDHWPGSAVPVRTNHELNVTPVALGVKGGIISYPVPPLVTRVPLTILNAPVGPSSNPSACFIKNTTIHINSKRHTARIFISLYMNRRNTTMTHMMALCNTIIMLVIMPCNQNHTRYPHILIWPFVAPQMFHLE